MTIAITLEVFLPIVNGVITSTINLAENLQKRGHRVIFLVPAWKAFTEPKVSGIPVYYIPSIPTHMYPGIRFVSPWNKTVERVITREKVDVLQITGPWLLSWSAIKAARRHNIPVIQVFHTLIYEDTYIYYGVKTKLLIPPIRVLIWNYIGSYVKRSTIMTAPSSHACRTIQEHFPKLTVKHILNGIDLTIFEKHDNYESLTKKYTEFNRKTFLFVGRLGEEKAVSVLLESFRLVLERDSSLKLFIVGDGPGRKDYEETVKKHALGNSIFFLGRLPHKELIHGGLIHYARAMITASTTENQPITIIEAIACGTPIIIPNVGGIKELLLDNGDSFLPDNPSSFADKILQMAHNDELHASYTEGGKKLRKAFDGMKVAGEFEKIYSEALNMVKNQGR